MANPDHVAKLKEGVEAWNTWREENNESRSELGWQEPTWLYVNVADLFASDQRGAKLDEVNLRGANLLRVLASKASLRRAQLVGANLSEADLRGADLSGANLSGADLRGADLRKANLFGAILRRVNVRTTLDYKHTVNFTDLSVVIGLEQDQIQTMRGDRFTKLPDHLTMPEHWQTKPIKGLDDVEQGEHAQDILMTSEASQNNSAAQTFMSQAKIVLANPVTSRLVATGVSEQLKAAIREFRENHQSNETPEVVLLLEIISTSFAALGREIDTPNNETGLASDIADIRDQISKLTVEIEELKSKPTDKSDFAKAKTAAAEAFGKTIGTGIAASVLGGAGYFFGAQGPEVMEALATAWSKVVGGSYPSAPTSPNIG